MSDLSEIKGIGNSIEEKLHDLGIETVNQLANTPLEVLESANIRRAQVIHERAKDQGVTVDSGEDVEREQNNTRYIPTGLQELDRMLGGGFQGGYLIGVTGEPKIGKTQFVMQALASAADFTDGAAVYIETEFNRFHIDRIKQLTRKMDSYKQVHRIQAHTDDSDVDDLARQRNAYDAIRETFDNVSLVVLDSFQSNFRLSGNYTSRADLPDRNSVIADHLKGLQSLGNEFDCPVLMTLQMMGNPDQFSAGSNSVWGPVLMDHTIAYFIYLSHSKGQTKKAELRGHPGLPDESVGLKIPEDKPIEIA